MIIIKVTELQSAKRMVPTGSLQNVWDVFHSFIYRKKKLKKKQDPLWIPIAAAHQMLSKSLLENLKPWGQEHACYKHHTWNNFFWNLKQLFLSKFFVHTFLFTLISMSLMSSIIKYHYQSGLRSYLTHRGELVQDRVNFGLGKVCTPRAQAQQAGPSRQTSNVRLG